MASIPALTTGLGRYTMSSPADDLIRVSSILDYFGKPTAWNDGCTLVCAHHRGDSGGGVQFNLLSNRHFEDETERLLSQNGMLTGATCGACGTAYIDANEEFAFNGTNAREGVRHQGVQLIHKPCRGKKGSRFTVSGGHALQKDRSDNIRILSELVHNFAINGLRRVLAPASGASEAGVARIYDRIFWLERVLLAYEKAQLAQWRARLAEEVSPRHTGIAQNDIVLTVNWETAKDTRVTSLNCAVSADIQSGYVFRIDVDIDPAVDPVSLPSDLFFDQEKVGDSLRKIYMRANGETFPAPRMSLQRPTSRFDGPALFASAVAQLRIFANTAVGALEKSVAPVLPSTLQVIDEAYEKADILEMIGKYYFNFGTPEREGRNTFTGIMTRNTYTKAAHLACLKEMLPDGKLTLVGEQEASMARVIPHIFREEIQADRFEWHVVTFDKDAKKPQIVRRTKAFDNAFRAYRDANLQTPVPEALHAWARTQLKPATKEDNQQFSEPFPKLELRHEGIPGPLGQKSNPGRRRDEQGHRVSHAVAALSQGLSQARAPGPDFESRSSGRHHAASDQRHAPAGEHIHEFFAGSPRLRQTRGRAGLTVGWHLYQWSCLQSPGPDRSSDHLSYPLQLLRSQAVCFADQQARGNHLCAGWDHEPCGARNRSAHQGSQAPSSGTPEAVASHAGRHPAGEARQ